MVRPVDAVVRDFVAKPARAAGFRQKGRRFVLTGDHGDQVGFDLQGSAVQYGNAEFYMNTAVWPRAWGEYLASVGQSREYDGTQGLGGRFEPPTALQNPFTGHGLGGLFVIQLDDATYAGKGAELQRFVTETVLPYLSGWTDPKLAADLAYDLTGRLGFRWNAWWRLFVLLDAGSHHDVGETWERLRGAWPSFDEEADPWVRERLRERLGGSYDRWVESAKRWWEPTRDDHRILLTALQTTLAPHGFVLDRGVFRRANSLGDEALVEIRPAATSTPDTLKFSVETGLSPAMYWQFRHDTTRLKTLDRPSIIESWCPERLVPDSAWTDQTTATAAFDLRQWTTGSGEVATCADAVTKALRPSVDDLVRHLDRELLTAAVADPASKNHGGFPRRLSLLLDVDPQRAADLIAAQTSTTLYMTEEEVSWARSRLE